MIYHVHCATCILKKANFAYPGTRYDRLGESLTGLGFGAEQGYISSA